MLVRLLDIHSDVQAVLASHVADPNDSSRPDALAHAPPRAPHGFDGRGGRPPAARYLRLFVGVGKVGNLGDFGDHRVFVIWAGSVVFGGLWSLGGTSARV